MKQKMVSILCIVCLVLSLVGCSTPNRSLKDALAQEPNLLTQLNRSGAKLIFKDYMVYNTGGGIEDAVNATRYAAGLVQHNDRFVDYRYVVEDRSSGWLYIFESLNDIPVWAKSNSK